MEPTVSYCLAGATIIGHVACWTWLYNRLHASGLASRLVQRLEKFVIVAMLASLLFVTGWVVWQGRFWMWGAGEQVHWLVLSWAGICWAMLVYVSVAWGVRRWAEFSPSGLLANRTHVLDLRETLGSRLYGDRMTRWLGGFPGNQILEIHCQHKLLVVPGLPLDLEGLRIAQVTDLHMTGQLSRAFFEAAIEETNRWDPELVAVTGDLVDKAICIDWIPDTLGKLTSHFGVYVLLGNHDQRLADVQQLRRALVDSQLEDVGGRSIVRRIRGTDVLISGNECPWFPPAPEVPPFDSIGRPFSILLSHSPDPLAWARRHRFDVMLAGHTHGGQIRFPVIGPVVCPSRYGVRYASGVFSAPPTLLHVSRGLSGVHTIRLNCPPELTLLELRRSEA